MKGFLPLGTTDMETLFLLNPSYNINEVEADDMIVAPIEVPQTMKDLGLENGKFLLLIDGNDGGMWPPLQGISW